MAPSILAAPTVYCRDAKDYLDTIAIEPESRNMVGRTLLEAPDVHVQDVRADPEYTLAEAES